MTSVATLTLMLRLALVSIASERPAAAASAATAAQSSHSPLSASRYSAATPAAYAELAVESWRPLEELPATPAETSCRRRSPQRSFRCAICVVLHVAPHVPASHAEQSFEQSVAHERSSSSVLLEGDPDPDPE